jgi:hypothetical protein
VSRHHLHFYQISARSDFKYGRQATILENQLRANNYYYSWTNACIIPTRNCDVKRGTLCTPRSDDLTDQISVRSDSWLGHQGAKTEKTSYNSWTNDGISSKFLSWVHLIRIHDIIPGLLIWPTFQGQRGQSSSGPLAGHICNHSGYWPELYSLECCVWCKLNNSLTIGINNKSVKSTFIMKLHVSTWSMDHFIWLSRSKGMTVDISIRDYNPPRCFQ